MAGFQVGPVEAPAEGLRTELRAISADVLAYFQEVFATLDQASSYRHYADVLTEENKVKAKQLRQRLANFGVSLLAALKSSPVLEQTDETVVRRQLRAMSAAISLKKYQYHEPYVISEEDQIHGVMPASQEEHETDLGSCEREFLECVESIDEKMDLIAPNSSEIASAIAATQVPSVRKYRPNTAFIMMQMDEDNGELEDIKNTIKDVFKEFDITAIRADDIEHSDVATQRVLNEIAASEFLIADLTGERPSVYYELGYAHAIDKRPILYRKKGTRLHFDVLVHNCPEYRNVTELKERLRNRLEEITGRRPKGT